VPATPGVNDPSLIHDPTFVPTNPAVLGWKQSGEIGVGVFRGERDRKPFNFPYDTGQGIFQIPVKSSSFFYDGTYAGAQAVAGPAVLAVEGISLRQVEGDEPLGYDAAALGAATRIRNLASVGVGLTESHDESTDNRSTTSGKSVGGSLRLWDVFYVGAATGTEHQNQTALTSSGSKVNGDRSSTGYGVAYLNEGPLRLHLEAWTATLDALKTKDKSNTGAGTLQSAIVEAAWGGFVFGYVRTSASVRFKSPALSADAKVEGGELTAGIAASRAFALLFHYAYGTTHFDGSNLPLKFETHSITRGISAVYTF